MTYDRQLAHSELHVQAKSDLDSLSVTAGVGTEVENLIIASFKDL